MNEAIICSVIGPTGAEHRRLANIVMKEALAKAGVTFDQIDFVVATGYGRINVPFADKQITEISCHARGVYYFYADCRTIIDIGGQDCKGIKIKNGKVIDFVMNDKCAAGTGRFLEVIADTLNIRLEDLGTIAERAREKAKISNICTVFAEQEVISRLSEGEPVENIVAGLHQSIASRICNMVERLKVEDKVVVTGGGAKNRGIVREIELILNTKVSIPPEPLLTGAVGASLLGKELCLKEGTVRRRNVELRELSLFNR